VVCHCSQSLCNSGKLGLLFNNEEELSANKVAFQFSLLVTTYPMFNNASILKLLEFVLGHSLSFL
jgi:hypothetical protein